MNRCKRCQVMVADDTGVCPLCEHVLTPGSQKQESTYPDVAAKTKWFRRIISIMIYCLIVSGVFLCVLDYYLDKKFTWSFIAGVCILYTVFTLHYSFNNQKDSHIRKIYWQTLLGMALLGILDFITGASGWSLVYGFPCVIVLLDIVLVTCMLVNLHIWQSYLLVQLFSLLASVVLLILYLVGVTHNTLLPWTAFGVSAGIFSFCFFIGNRKAKNELRRRFYI